MEQQQCHLILQEDTIMIISNITFMNLMIWKESSRSFHLSLHSLSSHISILQIKSHLLDNTRDSFTKLASALGISEHELQQHKLNEFARLPMIENYGTNPESSVEMNLRRIISMVHDLQATRAEDGLSSSRIGQNGLIITGPSSTKCDLEITQLQYELGSLCKTEMTMKDLHKQKLHELEDAWDKLVSLRRHISIFRSQIEETTIEDIHNQAAYPSSSFSSSSSSSRSASTLNWKINSSSSQATATAGGAGASSTGAGASSTETILQPINKQIHFHILREKLHIRTQLETTLEHYEKKLDSLREDIRKYSSILMESSQVPLPCLFLLPFFILSPSPPLSFAPLRLPLPLPLPLPSLMYPLTHETGV
jgi:hypothetical protein